MSQRETTEILGNVFTYTEALVSLAMRRKRPELLVDARELKYVGTSRLNKRELAIMLVDAYIADEDARAAKATAVAIAECDRIDASPKLHAEGTQVTLTATRQHGEVLGHTFKNGVLMAHVQLKNGVISVLPENEFHAMTRFEMRFAMEMPAFELRVVMQGHADYCARNGHAIHKLAGKITSLCPRCGEQAVTMHPNRENHGFIKLGNDKLKCIGEHASWQDAFYCAFDAQSTIISNPTTTSEMSVDNTLRGAFRLRSGDTVYTTTDRDAQPSFAGGWATKVYMDDAYFVITVRFDSYGDREDALSDLVKTWRGVSFERGDGNTTLTVYLPHFC